MNVNLRALNRFGLGARPGEAARLSDPREWLRSQLSGAPPDVPGNLPTLQQIGRALEGLRLGGQATPQERQEARRQAQQIVTAEETAVLRARVASERPFVERLVAFWSNHLTISRAGKAVLGPLAGLYEREAIRPHVLGRFEDMVLASARHPAMLVYLDNFQSIGPTSEAGRRSGRAGVRRGLNENYARELLELHTLGVDGGYEQRDVEELARIFTGWTVGGLPGAPVAPGGGAARAGRAAAAPSFGFRFEPALHEPGAKTVLGERIAEAGESEGEQVIRRLCSHPSTANFVARKLVSHFVGDDPAPESVAHIGRVFRDTGGDLRQVALALVDLEEAWSPTSSKFRSPQDWLVATLRAARADFQLTGIAPLLRQLRHPLWAPPSPAGYGDRMRDWADSEALLNRAELGRTLGNRLARGGQDPRRLLEVVDLAEGDSLRAFVIDTSIPPAERIALVFASPRFQWR